MTAGLATPVQYVKGVGPRLAEILKRLGITTVEDLFYHLPRRYIDRRMIASIADAGIGRECIVKAEPISQGVRFTGRRVYDVIFSDGTGRITARWFRFNSRMMENRFKPNTAYLLAGDIVQYGSTRLMIHPEIEVFHEEESELSGRILPIYPATEGLGQRLIRRIMKNAWDRFGQEVDETLPNAPHLMPRREALHDLHFPTAETPLDPLNHHISKAHKAIVFEECFYFFLGLSFREKLMAHRQGIPLQAPDTLIATARKNLPFTLTSDQDRALHEILQDLATTQPMQRLLQGDVGSGKTIVAILSALRTVESGHQVAVMAPTELLAQQHLTTFKAVMDDLRIPVAFLSSQVKGKERKEIYEGLTLGRIPVVVGTHALIQEEVAFASLGLVVIDEQHRFGVLQRQTLMQKGIYPHLLVMTATPIPRTLAMTVYGDLSVSIIREMPPGRKSIITKVYRESARERLYRGMQVELDKGHQIYVVYPLVEESEKMDLKNATDMAAEITRHFPSHKVALLHGRIKDKNTIMQTFKSGQVQILVATSVVEVGVDVPQATVIVIEHAERFGLSQLHQLRGRTGRSPLQSYCILVDHSHPGSGASERLGILQNTHDGFEIAEADLRMRGPGEFLGIRQSGLPELQVTNLATDGDIISQAKAAAATVLSETPQLTSQMRQIIQRRWSQKLSLGDVA